MYSLRARDFADGATPRHYWEAYRAPGLPWLLHLLWGVGSQPTVFRLAVAAFGLGLVVVTWLLARHLFGPRAAADRGRRGGPRSAAGAGRHPGLARRARGGGGPPRRCSVCLRHRRRASLVVDGGPGPGGRGGHLPPLRGAPAHGRRLAGGGRVAPADAVGPPRPGAGGTRWQPGLRWPQCCCSRASAGSPHPRWRRSPASTGAGWRGSGTSPTLAHEVVGPAVVVLALVGVVAGFAAAGRDGPDRGALLAAAAVFVITAAGLALVLHGEIRYLAPAYPWLLVAGAPGLERLGRSLPRAVRPAAAAVVVLVLAATAVGAAASATGISARSTAPCAGRRRPSPTSPAGVPASWWPAGCRR